MDKYERFVASYLKLNGYFTVPKFQLRSHLRSRVRISHILALVREALT